MTRARAVPAVLAPYTEECFRGTGHDFSRFDRDGLVRCWYCTRLSPRSRVKAQRRGDEAEAARELYDLVTRHLA